MANKLVNLKDGSDYLIPKVFGAIDTNNILIDVSESKPIRIEVFSYTATEDCFITYWNDNYSTASYPKIDNVTIFPFMEGYYDTSRWLCVQLKKGQKFEFETYSRIEYKAYGIKY